MGELVLGDNAVALRAFATAWSAKHPDNWNLRINALQEPND